MKLTQLSLGFILLVLSSPACTKVIAYGAVSETKPVTHTYLSNIQTTQKQTQRALVSLGYQIMDTDESRNRILTGWVPTTSDSHYLEYFNRRDYGAGAGSYYQLVADVFQEGNQVKVSVCTTIKSISGKLTSSRVVEKRLLAKLDDFMRSPQIVITNVGMQEH